jgi:hypothetical protein
LQALILTHPIHIHDMSERPDAVTEELEAESKIEKLKIIDENRGKY